MTTQLWLNTNLVRLQKAVLCANCEVISEGQNGHCACCGSQSLLISAEYWEERLTRNCPSLSRRLRMSSTMTCAFLCRQRPEPG